MDITEGSAEKQPEKPSETDLELIDLRLQYEDL